MTARAVGGLGVSHAWLSLPVCLIAFSSMAAASETSPSDAASSRVLIELDIGRKAARTLVPSSEKSGAHFCQLAPRSALLDRVVYPAISDLRRAGAENDDVVDPVSVDCVGTADGDMVVTTTTDGQQAAMAADD